MPHYLSRRNGGGYFYQRRVPKDLRHRCDVFKGQFIEEYLGTSDRAVAKRKVSAINEKWERTFEAMRRDESVTANALDQIRVVEQWRAHRAMVADPLSGPDKATQELQDFGPELEAGAREALAKLGLDANPRNIGRAVNAIWEGRFGAGVLYERGITPPEPKPYALPLLEITSPGGPTVSQAADAFTADRSVIMTDKTRGQFRQTAKLFADHVGHDTPASVIDGRAAVAFLNRLATISPDYRYDKQSKELSLAELEKKYPAGDGKGLSAATINRHATAMRVLFAWLIEREELPHDHRNPFAGKSRPVELVEHGGDAETYLPMTDGEIAALVKGSGLVREHATNFGAAIGWLVLLGAYTGARAGELCELIVDDVREKDRVKFIAIRHGKTKNARRVIPLHPKLIEAGFLDYVAKCDERLFGIDAKTLAKRFPAFRRKYGAERDGLVFHSLRKSFATKLHHADVSADTAAHLLGHKAERSFTFDVYSPHGPTLKQLARAVKKVKYEGVEI